MNGFVFSESPCFPRQSQGKHWDLREAKLTRLWNFEKTGKSKLCCKQASISRYKFSSLFSKHFVKEWNEKIW